jgi:hypothetical protein
MTRAASVPPEPPQPGREPLRSVQKADQSGGLAAPGRDGEDPGVSLGIELLRELAGQEVARAETARTRARQAFALAAGFFAVVQTVAYGSYVTSAATKGHRTETLLTWTAWAALALAVCGVLLVIAELPRKSHNLTPEIVLETINKPAGGATATGEFTELLALIVKSHRLANRVRFRLVVGTQVFAMAAIVLATSELLVGLHATL